MMAAAASAALDNALPLLPKVHQKTKAAAQVIESYGYKISLPVQTNMIVLDLEAADIPPAAFVTYCNRNNVLAFPTARLVFHFQITRDGVDRLLNALKELMIDKQAGKALEDEVVRGGYM